MVLMGFGIPYIYDSNKSALQRMLTDPVDPPQFGVYGIMASGCKRRIVRWRDRDCVMVVVGRLPSQPSINVRHRGVGRCAGSRTVGILLLGTPVVVGRYP